MTRTTSVLRPVLRRALRANRALIAIAVVTAAISALTVTATLLVAIVLVPAGRTGLALAIAAGLVAFAYLLNWISGAASRSVQRRMLSLVEEDVWNRLLRKPIDFYTARSTRDLLSYAGAVSMLRRLLGAEAIDALVAGVSVLITCGVLVLVDPWLAVIAFVVAGMIGLAAGWLFRRQQHHDVAVMGGVESAQTLLYPAITGRDEVTTYGGTDFVQSRWLRVFRAQKRADLAGLRYANAAGALLTATPVIFLAVLCSGDLAQRGGLLGLGTIAVIALQLGNAVTRLLPVVPAVFAIQLAGERLLPMVADQAEAAAAERAQLPPSGPTGRELRLRSVSFGYGGDIEPLVRDASAVIPAGSFTAIIGQSGSGKSTVLNLLLGLMTPTAGQVQLDGIDLRAIDDADLRRDLGYVPQTGALLRGTLRDAVRGFRSEVSDAHITQALARAGLGEVVARLPMGLDTRISDGATGFSGGQEQRILIARALVAEPSVLVLDEATSALDLQTQEAVSRSIADLRMTRVVVAHRLETLACADQILLLSAGRLRPVATRDTTALRALITDTTFEGVAS
ncbi:peptidase domain-containing ABC transporter [Flexivirga caeni]|uniref:ATP-binding cassette domain-containing protein n=1 Tax=Flexivirga caeni TaxID=2294115 RepID=A0A3M9M7D8_9MICO|nr:ATP-binding cassette domain-containing protein [Flexivirga caeni]RNI21115.1 ATP-binding cassette domain-containing protein [Flexivirga caeni]